MLALQIRSMAITWAVLFVCALVPVVSAPISAPEVCALFQAGASVADIATRYMVTDRRVRQIVQDGVVRRDLQPQPSEAVLDQIMAAETARFGFGMFDVAWCIAAATHSGASQGGRCMVGLKAPPSPVSWSSIE